MSFGRILIIFLFIILGILERALAIPNIPYPTSDGTPTGAPYRITSAFGPRLLSGDDIVSCHQGIDFAGLPNVNDPVFALLSGKLVPIVTERRSANSFVLVVEVQGVHKFRYLHMFRDDKIAAFWNNLQQPNVDETVIQKKISLVLRLTRRAYREDPVLGIIPDPRYALVVLDDCGYAIAIYHPEPDQPIFVKDENGNPILSSENHSMIKYATNNITAGVILGPVGDSGRPNSPHLHVDLQSEFGEQGKMVSPLAYIIHPEGGKAVYQATLFSTNAQEDSHHLAYKIIESPFTIDLSSNLNPVVRVGISYPETADLDRVEVYVDVHDDPNRTRLADWAWYGADLIKAMRNLTDATLLTDKGAGVLPRRTDYLPPSGKAGDVGWQIFVCRDWASIKDPLVRVGALKEGNHCLWVKASPISGAPEYFRFPFIIVSSHAMITTRVSVSSPATQYCSGHEIISGIEARFGVSPRVVITKPNCSSVLNTASRSA